ncbi:sensor histidine kinase [Paludibacterium yongneupense]|uniref:sensor histidine kinase n=1 Tax=Paludibacterium yongneupense TaxID=400061 RepID=UPI00040CDA31|nr:histidine kinase [Paludibacterium yongneupense]
MHPILADLRKLLVYVLACLLAGSVAAGLLWFGGTADGSPALAFALPLCLVYGFIVLSAYPVCRALPYVRRRPVAALALFGGTTLVSASAWLALATAWNVAGQAFGLDAGFIAMNANLRLILFLAGAGAYVLSLLAHDVLIAFENVRAAVAGEAESRLMARDAELRMLRSQIDPHFLFNCLNSISALTSLDPAAARDMTIDLAQFFRRTLALSTRETIPLSEEMALCEHYLAIEKRRFGSRLNVELTIAPGALHCLLPPLTLQPLLENALKHGIRELDEGGTVTVVALARDEWLHLAVSNPLASHPATASDSGLGLKTCRARLTTLYGERARIVWQRKDGQFKIELAIPQPKEIEA